ncbi:MAG: hypothetical protein ACOC46_02995 [Pirellulales bacterium]
MLAMEQEKLRASEDYRKEWKKTAEDLRALSDACLEIAGQMDEMLEEAEAEQEPLKARAG